MQDHISTTGNTPHTISPDTIDRARAAGFDALTDFITSMVRDAR